VDDNVVDLRTQIEEQWSRRLAGEELRLPSGATVLTRSVTILGLIEQGKIPNALYGMSQKMLEEDEVSVRDPEEVKSMAEIAKILVVESVLFPKIVESEPNYPKEILFSDLTDEDITFIVNGAMRGVQRLNKFREEQRLADQARQDSPSVLDEAIRAARTDEAERGMDSVPD
jgi:hypothetical protein